MKTKTFNLMLCLSLSMLASVNAAEPEREKKESVVDCRGWHCLSGSWSDQKLKNSIEPLGDVSGTIDRLKPYSFTWNDSNIKALGLIAQNVEQADPRLVITSESGLKQVYVPGVVALLLAEVKTLRAEVNTLKAQQAK
ncbi:tail fiber domain-containing protein [Chitinimonas sp. BJB300]|uniref:tail fiber domain-containing protein n=1 Tax=Chitinimonas sp. BJB300 TaxID=1559339 RepID=UPI000C101BD0|nr:tail fiber domain-containing protein [Chitinimonas sp. BJB300]PHV10488.1 hypothetical protein CSQ89_15880 [Chitinimonas sp. BJB300]TSJ89869.1 tail fiber domain-containing protein [Chitinimonas sp. BJB300]